MNEDMTMTMTTLAEAFEAMVQYAKSQSTRQQWDSKGSVPWDAITEALTVAELPDIPLSWNRDMLPGGDIYQMLTRRVMSLPDRSILGDGTELYTKIHPLIDTLRIPLKYECTVNALLIIAFYAGYISACSRAADYPVGIHKLYRTLTLCKLDTFLASKEGLSVTISLEAMTQLFDSLSPTCY